MRMPQCHTPLLKIPVWWRRAVLPSLPWVLRFLSFFLFPREWVECSSLALAEEEYDKIAPVIACTLPALTDSIPEEREGSSRER